MVLLFQAAVRFVFSFVPALPEAFGLKAMSAPWGNKSLLHTSAVYSCISVHIAVSDNVLQIVENTDCLKQLGSMSKLMPSES